MKEVYAIAWNEVETIPYYRVTSRVMAAKVYASRSKAQSVVDGWHHLHPYDTAQPTYLYYSVVPIPVVE